MHSNKTTKIIVIFYLSIHWWRRWNLCSAEDVNFLYISNITLWWMDEWGIDDDDDSVRSIIFLLFNTIYVYYLVGWGMYLLFCRKSQRRYFELVYIHNKRLEMEQIVMKQKYVVGSPWKLVFKHLFLTSNFTKPTPHLPNFFLTSTIPSFLNLILLLSLLSPLQIQIVLFV